MAAKLRKCVSPAMKQFDKRKTCEVFVPVQQQMYSIFDPRLTTDSKKMRFLDDQALKDDFKKTRSPVMLRPPNMPCVRITIFFGSAKTLQKICQKIAPSRLLSRAPNIPKEIRTVTKKVSQKCIKKIPSHATPTFLM